MRSMDVFGGFDAGVAINEISSVPESSSLHLHQMAFPES